MTDHLVIIDVGTTAVKAAAVDRNLRVLREASAPVETSRNGDLVEQDPDQWWASAVDAVRALTDLRPDPVARDVERLGTAVGLAITGQMQDLVLVRDGAPVGPAVLYSDHRATAEHQVLLERVGADRWFELTANEQDASNLAAKLMWLGANQPERLKASAHVLFGAHSFLAYRACGAVVCDPTTASTTGLYDPTAQGWAEDVLTVIGDLPTGFPTLHSPLETCGQLERSSAEELGLRAGIPVFHSAGDAGTTTVGAGIGEDGGRYAYLGTSGWLASTTAAAVTPRPSLFTLEHPLPGHRIQIGPMLSVGACLDWARERLLRLDGHEDLERLVELSSAPSRLLFLPYLAGERAPMRDPGARGAIVGLTPTSDAAEVARAVMEGVALSLRAIADLMEPDGHDGPLVVAGGASRSDAWCQILADVFGSELKRLDSIENVGVLGTAMLSWSALGGAIAPPQSGSSVTFEPDAGREPIYDRLRQLQHRAYLDLGSVVRDLNQLAEQA